MNSPVIEDSFSREIVSEDNKTYVTRLWCPTVLELGYVWSKLAEFRVLFTDSIVNDFGVFTRKIMCNDAILARVHCDDEWIGLLYFTGIRPAHFAEAHYVFWDKKSTGRQRLILTMLKAGMNEFGLHRVTIMVPVYAGNALYRLKRMRICCEGIRREAVLYEGRWRDVLEFGVLRSELTDDSLHRAQLSNDTSWHKRTKHGTIITISTRQYE